MAKDKPSLISPAGIATFLYVFDPREPRKGSKGKARGSLRSKCSNKCSNRDNQQADSPGSSSLLTRNLLRLRIAFSAEVQWGSNLNKCSNKDLSTAGSRWAAV